MDVPVLMLESPMQIALVLVIALVVFGPKKLPEIGRQLGSALRELRKATHDITRSFATDYEPDPEPYSGHNQSYGTVDYGYRGTDYSAPADLTDYTIAGLPPNDTAAIESTERETDDAYAISPSSSVMASQGAEPGSHAAASEADRNAAPSSSESSPASSA